MDVLYSIPEELWREIFALIPVSWIYGADLSSDPVRRFRSHEMDFNRIGDTQSSRLALMLICRALLPLAEELLYSEVYISSPTAAGTFIETSRLTHGERLSPGRWTRRISIDTMGWTHSSVATTFERLKKACPNISCLHTEQDFWGFLGVKKTVPEYSSLLRDLRTLTVTGVSFLTRDLAEIARECPNLINLHLYPSTLCYGGLQSITFPSLRRLSISSHLIYLMVDAEVIFLFPLEWLSIAVSDMTEIPALTQFCRRHGSNLVGLELTFATKKYGLGSIMLPSDFLDFGVNLRTFIIAPSIALDSSGQSATMEKLNEVILRADIYHSTFSALAFAEYFAPTRFPHIYRIVVIERLGAPYGAAKCGSIKELLPNVSVERRPGYE